LFAQEYPQDTTNGKMNRSGCSEGWATDRILFYENPELNCDLSITAWIILGSILISLKALYAVVYSYSWLRREAELRKNKPSSRGTRLRLPIMPALAWVFFVTYLLFFVLSGTYGNEINVLGFLYGLGWCLFGIMYMIYLVKFMKLGHRIDPRPAANRNVSIPNEELTRIDLTGKVGLYFSGIALTGQTLMYCILGPIFSDNYVIVRIANGFECWFMAQTSFAMIHHFERIRKASVSFHQGSFSQSH
jgi:hypothetical protein